MAVEVAKNPKLRGLPVVTGADRGIVTAASYEAKALGVTRGLPIFRLKKQFPQVIIMPGDYPSYSRYSSMMFDIVRRYADDVEEYSIDECFADLTGLDHTYIGGRKMSVEEIALRIKKEINEELDLSISVGLAPTKVLAKAASKWKKPNGFTVIEKENAPAFLADISIEKIWGIGGQTSAKLKKMGIKTALDLAQKDRAWVGEHLSKPYATIWYELNSQSIMNIDPDKKTIYSSIQKTGTFHPPTSDMDFLLSQLSYHAEQACAKARRYELIPRRISFFLKTQDFSYAYSEIELPFPSYAPSMIIPLIRNALVKMHAKGILYRATGVILRELSPKTSREKDLFGNVHQADRFEAIHSKIDKLENKYGKKMVYLASSYHEDDEEEDREGNDRDLLFL